MKDQIETNLRVLIGQPLVSVTRAANMQMFGFGKWVDAIEGEARKVGEYALHLQCVWRVVSSNRIIVAQRDMYYPLGDPETEPEHWMWDRQGANRCDERTKRLITQYTNCPLIVESIVADEIGGLSLLFSEGIKLEVFPDDSLPDEYWRFFKPGTEENHFVVSGEGVETG
jgi:hypothetical protein